MIVDRRAGERRARAARGRAAASSACCATAAAAAWPASSPRCTARTRSSQRGVKVVVHVDGGARGNPGPAAGAAVHQRRPTARCSTQASELLGVATNNVAEYRGLLLGLRARARARRDRGRAHQRLRARRQAADRRLQGQAPRHAPAARAGARGAARRSSAGRSARCRARRTRSADALVNAALDARDALKSTRADRVLSARNRELLGAGARGAAGDRRLHGDLHPGRQPALDGLADLRRRLPRAVPRRPPRDPPRAAARRPLPVPARRGARERRHRDDLPDQPDARAPAGAVAGRRAGAVRGDDRRATATGATCSSRTTAT